MMTSSLRPVGPEPAAVAAFLRRCLSSVLGSEEVQWLDGEIRRDQVADQRGLTLALASVARRIPRADLVLSTEEIAAARRLREHWHPELWSADEAARVALLLAAYCREDEEFARRIDDLCAIAEITEHVAYLKGFAVFPAPRRLHGRAREGVRSSIRPVFEAIACHNPYPFDHFDDAAWNQMVVKCVFVEAPLESIVGLRERRNADLVGMLRDFVAERSSAGRPLPESVHRFIAGD